MDESVVALQLGDYAIIGTIIAGVVGLSTTLMLHTVKMVAARVGSVEERVGAVEERIKDVERYKTDKRDWAREELLTRNNIAALHGQMERIEGKLDTAFGMSAAVNRLADQLGKTLEKANG